ncbi:TPR-like protein [Flagelloscypha sp. PMI_526]|nr:TPR-like protein [Flagelloscypha sp. PMI_526]
MSHARHARQPEIAPHLNGSAPTTNGSAPSTSAPRPRETIIEKLTSANEATWLLIGSVAEQMGNLEHALSAYENVLRHNPNSLAGLTKVAGIARIKENYGKAIEYFQRVLNVQEDNGEVWSALGHCYLMQDDLQKAYAAYQQALYLLPNPKEDLKLWYGIGILYDRYGSLDLAEEAFSSVLRMNQDFDKTNEILFRLGIIYKQQGKFEDSLGCLQRILRNPPSPLAHADIWFQIGHVYEMQKKYTKAKDAYERVSADNPNHAKVWQQLGWLYHQEGSTFQNQELAIQYLTKSLESDPSDSQSWYLLGRAYMAGQKYNKAYEAYQQAVYRDGRNPTFWCSIGVLYFQINQFRDALDAYSRAIRINPYISEVWFDLGSLYESCNNQISDAIDAYARASELDPNNTVITQRLQLLRQAQATGQTLPGPPGPQDVHPTAYASTVNPPVMNGPNLLAQAGTQTSAPRHIRPGSRSGPNEMARPGSSRNSPGPFRGGVPPPVNIDDSRQPHGSHAPLAPMEVERPGGRDYPPTNGRGRENGNSLLLHHPSPHHTQENGRPGPPDAYFSRPSSGPTSPRSTRNRSPVYPPPPSRRPAGPGEPPAPYQPSPRSAHAHAHSHEPPPSSRGGPREDPGWERRNPSIYPPPPPDARESDRFNRERERERGRPRHSSEYASPREHGHYGGAHSPVGPPAPRVDDPQRHPPERRGYVPLPRGAGGRERSPGPAPPPPSHGSQGFHGRYDPLRFDREFDERNQAHSPDGARPMQQRLPSSHQVPPPLRRDSESPHPTLDGSRKRKASTKEEYGPGGSVVGGSEQQKAKKKRGTAAGGRTKKEDGRSETPKPSPGYRMSPVPTPGGPSSSGSGSGSRPSPTGSSGARPPVRTVDEDYDEPGVADALIGMAAGGGGGYRPPPSTAHEAASRPSPTGSSGADRPPSSRTSPPNVMKRQLSGGPDEMPDREREMKRSRMDGGHAQPIRRTSSGGSASGEHVPSTRPSPIPFRTQAPPHQKSSTSPPPMVLPPHPRPTGATASGSVALPPITTLASSSSGPGMPSGSPRTASGSPKESSATMRGSRSPPGMSPGSENKM